MPQFYRRLIPCFLMLLSYSVSGQVTAGFIASDTAGCVPLLVNFTNTSIGAATYSWDLGNGTITTTSTPSGSYTSPGTYTVSLTATNGALFSTTTTVIRVYPNPAPAFVASDTAFCPGLSTTFTNTSTSGAWGASRYKWNFGDGFTSTIAAPSHVYALPGYYTVTLFDTSAPGCFASFARSSYIHAYTPANIAFSTPDVFFCKPPGTSHFTNTSTGFPGLTYLWRFGDGGTSSAASPVHTYTTAGSYPVTLIITDGHSCTDSFVHSGYVSVGPLVARFTAPSTTCKFVSDTFNNTSTTHVASLWDFGDGTGGIGDPGVHTYTAAGTYSVKLVVFDGTCYDTVTHPITVSPGPTGSFVISPAQPCQPPVNVTFTASVPAGCTVNWKFGDTAAMVSGASVVHRYLGPVTDYIDMIIIDPSGCRDTVQRIDTFYSMALEASSSPTSGCAPLAVTFGTSVASPGIYDAVDGHYLGGTLGNPAYYFGFSYPYTITSYSWNFGDGSPPASGATPSHTYTAPGVFTATCSVTTSNGCTNFATQVVKVGVPLTPTFTMTPTHICADRSITLTCTNPGLFDSYYWYYGDIYADSTTSSIEIHDYTIPGHYTVTLYGYNNGCRSVPVTAVDTVDSANAVQHLTYSCTTRNVVTFNDLSVGETSHTWSFGDASTSTLLNPTHTYPALSPFNAYLATYNSRSGCRDTSRFLVDLTKPVVKIAARDSTICRDVLDTFISSFAGGTLSSIRWKWYVDGICVDSTHNVFIYPYHIRGLHYVQLINTDNHGCLDSSNFNSILIAKPIAAFSLTPTSGCAPLPVSFTDFSTDVAGTSLTRYAWTFGDGLTSTLTTTAPLASHTYTALGTYTVKEIVTDNLGCKDTLISSTHPTVSKPTASFSLAATSVCMRALVHFTNTSTGSAGAFWSFGDGATSTVTSPDHAYTATGTYSIKLVAIDAGGCPSDTLVRTGYITVRPLPSASFTMSDTFAVCPPLNVTFNNTSTGAIGYLWNFGDGSSSLAMSPGDAYSTPGRYTVMLVDTNSFGCTDTAIHYATVFGYRGAFSYTPKLGCNPLAVHFSASVSHVMTLVWDFADGGTSGASITDTITHWYAHAGSYLPKLILTDSTGCANFSLGSDTIRVDSVMVNFSSVPAAVCLGGAISFTDASSSYFSTDSAWTWSFGSGVTRTGSPVSNTYTAAGTYPVTLTVTDKMRCFNSATQNVTISSQPGIITGVTTICAGTTTNLTDAGGGTWSTAASPLVATVDSASGVVSGVSAGTAMITYTLPTGCFTTVAVTIFAAPAPITGITSLCTGSTVALTDPSPGGTWSSGTASVASVGSATGIVYGASPGTAVISYSTLSGLTCESTTTVTVNAVPVAITGPSTACQGLVITLSDLTPGGVWSSSNASVASINSGTGDVTGVSAGTAIVTYSNAGCLAVKIVTVYPLGPITGATTVCAGLTTVLTDAAAPGGTWASGNPAVAGIGAGTGIVTGHIFGTAIVTYSLPTGCSTTTTVNVNSIPAPITGTLYTCIGSTTTLSGSGGGTWMSGNPSVGTVGSATGVITGVSAGTVPITYLLGSGCQAQATVTVYTIPLAISGTAHVCIGSTTLLSDATPGGTWSSSDMTIASTGSALGFVYGVSAGTATISYSRAGCAATIPFTVDSLPSAISGGPDVCVGLTTALISSPAGGLWSSGSPSVATVAAATGIVTGVSAGAAVITYTLLTGCITTGTITVDALPAAITGATNVCEAATALVFDASAGGSWLSSDPAIATITGVGATTAMVSGVAAGTVMLTYTLHTGCTITRGFTVNPLPAPITGSPVACIGVGTPLSDAYSGGIWNSSNIGVATVGITTGVVYGVSSGITVISYTLPTGCMITTTEIVNPLPLPISGLLNICVGNTTTLLDGTPGGYWSTSAPSIASIGMFTGSIAGISAGTVTTSYTVAGCSVTARFVVNRLPAPITGADSVCAGGGTALVYDADAPYGTWSSISVGISPTGVLSGLAPGTGIIRYTLPTGCFVTKTITIVPLPATIAGPGYVCLGGTITLTDASTGGVWSSPGYTTFVTTDSVTGVVTGVSNGTAVITYTLPTGCINTKSIAVNPQPSLIAGPSGVCAGAAITLSDSTAGGQWSSGSTTIATVGTSTGIVSGITGGTVTISYSVTNLCGTSIVTKNVTVNPLPDAGTIFGTSNICLGATVSLTDAVAGGVWRISNSKAAISASGALTALNLGADTVSYVVANTCGSDTTNFPVVISPQPDAGFISGPSQVCAGSSITLTDTASGGVWGVTNNLASVSSSGLVTASAAGTDTVLYSVSNGCGTAIAAQVVGINPPPDAGLISGPAEVCVNSSITLTDNIAGGSWRATNGAAALNGGIVNGVTAGIDTVIYSVTNSCGIANTVQTITVNPLPEAGTITGADSLCPGDTATFNSTIQGGAWSASDTSISFFPQGGSLLAKTPGRNNVTYTITNSCGSASATKQVIVRSYIACEGDQLKLGCSGDGDIVIYPNPNLGTFNVKIISAVREDVTIIVYNAIGQKIGTLATATNELTEIKLMVAQGVYIVSAITAHGKCNEKVVVDR